MKLQASTSKFQSSSKFQIPKTDRSAVLKFGAWSFFGAWMLRLEVSKSSFIRASTLAALLLPILGRAQPSPHIGYVFPAGGRTGTTFQVTFGGQFLDGVTNVFVSGTGVQGKVIDFIKPMAQGEFNRLRDKLREFQDKRQQTLRNNRKGEAGRPNVTNIWTAADEKAITEIRQKILKNPPNRQATAAIAENVVARITVVADAEVGEREIRLGGPLGLSNPLKFYVGSLPEFSELPAKAPNPDLDRLLERMSKPPSKLATQTEMRITLPACVNGQITPGAVDRFRFHAQKGQRLVAIVSARDLIPYLADAVPGWFQATIALYDSKGQELAYNDDYRFHPDPVLFYHVAKEGEYLMEIKDAIYRGREDFVYRITIGELPFVTSIFPLGGRVGETTAVQVQGYNLDFTTLTLTNTAPGFISIPASPASTKTKEQQFNLRDAKDAENSDTKSSSASIASLRSTKGSSFLTGLATHYFAVNTLPECAEQETNGSPAHAQKVALPIIINGRIDQPGDQDIFRFEGHQGAQIVAEVLARRLDSPVDSMLKLSDETGKQLAFNDDYEDKGCGLTTHHADSYIRAILPADGFYFVHLSDAQHKGGVDCAYRLRISAPQPDFELRVTPSSINTRSGVSVPLTVIALRKDGFSNEISIVLKDAPPGFSLSGGRIPAGQEQVRVTLTASASPTQEPVSIALEGRAKIVGAEIIHQVVPADDLMQAFAYRHLVPAQQLLVAARRGIAKPVRIIGTTPVKIPVGSAARVQIAAPELADRFQLELSEPPAGIALGEVTFTQTGPELVLQSDASKVKPGLKGNLIVNILSVNSPVSAGKGKKQGNQRRAMVGTLPAIPFDIVEAEVTRTVGSDR